VPDFSCLNVTERGKLVVLVAHHRDGDWELLCGGDEHFDSPELVILHREHLEALDATLIELRDLPRGWEATRDSSSDPWLREAFSEEDDDDAGDDAGAVISRPRPANVCAHCGTTHEGLLTDSGFKLPDDVWSIPEPLRAARANFNTDLCKLDDRYFLRGILYVPFTERAGEFGWGVWSEVDETTFSRYVELYNVDASADEPLASGTLANALPCYRDAIAEPLSIRFGSSNARPEFFTLPESQTSLARDRSNGMGEDRYHEILVALRAI
jgi:hypothetical protein